MKTEKDVTKTYTYTDTHTNLFFCLSSTCRSALRYLYMHTSIVSTQRNPGTHTYLSTHATNCNRLDQEAVKWRSPCVWPQLISCNVVFYVMPHSPRTLCSLQPLINTLNQMVSIWHPWACLCICLCVWVCTCVPSRISFCYCFRLLCMWSFGMLSSAFVLACGYQIFIMQLFNKSLACIEYIKSKFKVAELDLSQMTFQDIHCCLLIWYEIRIFRQNVIFVSHNVWHYLRSLFSSSAHFSVNPLMLNEWQSVD